MNTLIKASLAYIHTRAHLKPATVVFHKNIIIESGIAASIAVHR